MVAPTVLLTISSAIHLGATKFLWSDAPPYYESDELPVEDAQSCCGQELVHNPAQGSIGMMCVCDITDGACDTNCCCDLDCSYEYIKVGSVFGCTSNSTAQAPKGYTTCSDQIVSTNIPQQASGLVHTFGGADGLLCIVKDNTPSRGGMLTDPTGNALFTPERSSRVLDTLLPVTFGITQDMQTMAGAPSYRLGDAVKGDGCIAASSDAGCGGVGTVLLPKVGLAGGCDDKQTLRFLSDVRPFTCDLRAHHQTLESACATTLNGTFLHQARFNRAPSSNEGNATLDFYIYTSEANSSVSSAAPPMSAYSAGACSNAMVTYQLRLYVGTAGTLEKVHVYTQLSDLTDADWEQTKPSYGAEFVYLNNQAQVRPTSGRPGYQRGLPLLVADGTSLRRDGLLMLPQNDVGICGSGTRGAEPVLFGEDSARTCVMRVTAEELKQSCSAGSAADQHPLIAVMNITDASTIPVRIGVYGDSFPGSADDWVDLKISYPSGLTADTFRQYWDEEKQECLNVLSGISMRVLTAKVGAARDPAVKVIGADLSLISRNIRVARCALGESNCKTTISVTSTTTFASIDSESFEFIPSNPQLIPALPYDLFYPFNSR